MDFIIIFVIIGVLIIGLNQLEKQRKAELGHSTDNQYIKAKDGNYKKFPKHSKILENWPRNPEQLHRLALSLEKSEREKDPKYICRIGRISSPYPTQSRFVLLEEVLTEQPAGRPYIVENWVDCLLVEKLVTKGSLVLFHDAGHEINEFGYDLLYGIAVSAFKHTQDETMQKAWNALYREAKLAQNEALIRSIAESL